MNSSKKFNNDIELLLTKYAKNKKSIDVNFRNIVPELNRADRATHLIHTYPAKLLMHIPYFFLSNDIFSKPGNTVLDPFCGSGTVLLESLLTGRNSYGADSNPLARLIAKVKVAKLEVDELQRYSDILKKTIRKSSKSKASEAVDIDYWFLPPVKQQLSAIHDKIIEIENLKYREFFLVCFSNCVKKVSLADPRVSVPVRLRHDQYTHGHPLKKASRQLIKSLETIIVKDKFLEIVQSNIARVHSLNELNHFKTKGEIVSNDARELSKISSNRMKQVDLIITSPPYAGAQKYIRASSLNIGWLDLAKGQSLKDIQVFNIGREDYLKKEYDELQVTGIKDADSLLSKIYKLNPLRAYIASNYLVEMREALQECVQVLKPGGFFVMVIASNQVCGHEFKTHEYLLKTLQEMGLRLVLRLIDDIKSYGLMTKRNKTASIITREWVLVLQK